MRLIQSVFFNPGLRHGSETDEPVIESLQTPTSPDYQPAVQPFVFQTPKPVTHGHRRLSRVPINVGLRSGTGKAQVFHQMPHRLLISVAPRLQVEVDQDPVTTPQGVVQLLDWQPTGAVDLQIDHHLLAPESPAFVKDSMSKQAPPFARMAVGGHELQVVSWIRLVRAGQGNSKMLLLLV